MAKAFDLLQSTGSIVPPFGAQVAEYMLRVPFSLEKVTWNEKAKKVTYRSKRSWHTKQNFQVFTAADFITTTVEHIPRKSQ